MANVKLGEWPECPMCVAGDSVMECAKGEFFEMLMLSRAYGKDMWPRFYSRGRLILQVRFAADVGRSIF